MGKIYVGPHFLFIVVWHRHSDLTQKVSAELRLQDFQTQTWKITLWRNGIIWKTSPEELSCLLTGIKIGMWTIFVKLNYILDEPAWPALCEPIFGSMSLKVLATLSRLHVKGFISFSCMEHTLQTLNVNETLLWSWTTVFHWIAKYAKGFWNTFVETKQNIASGNYTSNVTIYISPLFDTQPCLKDLHTPKAQRKR